MNRLLLLVESNTTGTGRLFARRAAALGLRPVLLTTDPSRYPYVAQDAVDYVLTDTSDQEAVVGIAGVTSSSEYYIETAAACARSLGRPGPAPDAVRACRHKGVQREILAAAGVSGPAFALARTSAEVRDAAIPYPVVVKPCCSSGSLGVRLCADEAEAAAHAAELLGASRNERGLPVPGEILVEEFMTGPEYSVEVLAGRAVATVGKHTGQLPWFVETGHDTPAPLTVGRARLLAQTAEQAVAALGLGWGAVHVELRFEPSGPRIVEVNPRLAGGMIPDLIHRAYGIDLVDAQVRAAAGLPRGPGRSSRSAASIRFLTADGTGTVRNASAAVAAALAVDGVAAAAVYRADGTDVAPATDFRGRIGHVIAVSSDTEEAAAAADRAMRELSSAVRPQQADPAGVDAGIDSAADTSVDRRVNNGVDTGRLKAALNPQAHRIVYGASPGSDAVRELRLISEVDRAHLVMLTERGIVAPGTAARLLSEIERLRGEDFAALSDHPMPRGPYLAYEGLLSDLLGEETGGVLHTGRSRNDLSATTARLRARAEYVALLEAVDALAGALVDRALQYQDVVMPAYTHGQPAVPITFGHYLAGVTASVVRGYGDLLAAGTELESSPLGAGAVGGTSVPIDPWRTAQLLGFSGLTVNSVDAVASRDFALRLLAAASTLAVTLARVARDVSGWTTEESGLLRLADDLVGSSSMMPQKRNPFLLEHIAGKASASLGCYVSAAAAMASAGYTNSITSGTEAMRQLWPGLRECTDSATLLRLVIEGAAPDEQRMRGRATEGFTAATYYAERLVAAGVPFRTAHHQVGRTVLAAIEAGTPLAAAAPDGMDLDPVTVVAASAFGGGPGEDSVKRAAGLLRAQAEEHRGVLSARQIRWADAAGLLNETVRRITGADPDDPTSSAAGDGGGEGEPAKSVAATAADSEASR